MTIPRGSSLALLLGALTAAAFVAPTSAQQPAAGKAAPTYPEAQLVPGFRFINTYLFPSEPIRWECCAPPPELVIAQKTTGGIPAPPQATVTVDPRSSRIARASAQSTCVNLSELTPLERILRQTRASFGACFGFVTYDQYPCTCETLCNDSEWYCNCPGIPPGQLPQIKPQDSLGSQPEFLGTTCIPCGAESTCAGQIPPGADPPA